MRVIVTYKNFQDTDRKQMLPEVFKINENETPEQALRKIWEYEYNCAISDNLNYDCNDPLNEDECWFEEDMAQIAWEDGDTKEFYVVEVELYK